MAKVICICGKICCGKSTYALQLMETSPYILLSVDEFMLAMFGQHAGPNHDRYTAALQQLLRQKAADICKNGTSVILDWGFWTQKSRQEIRSFFEAQGIPCELHYLEVSDSVWQSRIRKRNEHAAVHPESAYVVDQNLAEKFERLFEVPSPGEADVILSI